MKFIKPVFVERSSVEWEVTDRTKAIVKYYAEYTGLSENEILDRFLLNILDDEDFQQWIQNKRRNARMLKQLYPERESEVMEDEQAKP